MKGVVEKITDRQWQGKTFYSFALKGEDGWFSLGVKRPNFNLWDYVDFEFTVNSKGYKDVKGDITVSKGEVVEAKTTPRAFQTEGTGKPGYWEQKGERDIETQKRIQKQASRNSALTMVSLLLGAGAIKLPEKQAGKYDVVVGLVQEWFERFEAQIDNKDLPVEEVTVQTTEKDGWEAA